MKRLYCGTDIALIGAWDVSMNDNPISKNNFTNIEYTNLSTCENSISESLTITVNQLPTVDAGSPQTICSNTTAPLAGIISGDVSTGTWSGGTGTYSTNANDLNAEYTPSEAEVAAGSVTLTLTSADPAGPGGSCQSAREAPRSVAGR